METKKMTAQEIADYYNESEELNVRELERIIEENGFVSDCGETWGVCHNESEKVVINDDGEAYVVTRHGGRREGAGRPTNDRNIAVSVRISKEAYGILKQQGNKSEFIDNLIKKKQA